MRLLTDLRTPTTFLVAVAMLALAFAATASGHDVVELDEAEVFIEWNSTDTDFGIQFFCDSIGFTSMSVRNGDGKRVLKVRTAWNMKAQGLTEGFFESVEPPASELSMREFFDRHPEGTYTLRGLSIGGDWLVGEAEFAHTLPARPRISSPRKTTW